MYASPVLTDFIIEVEFDGLGAEATSQYSIIFRSDDVPGGLLNYSIVSLNPTSKTIELAVWKDNEWVLKTSLTISDGFISFDNPIRFRREVSGSEFRVFLNGNFADEFFDNQIQSAGIVGISITTGSALESFTFDNLSIYGIE